MNEPPFDWSAWMGDDTQAASAVFLTGSPWACEACTYQNGPDLCRCEICGTWKPGFERKPSSRPSPQKVEERYPYWELQKPIKRPEKNDDSSSGSPIVVPSEVWQTILSFLPWKERLNASLVCWEWRACSWALFTSCNMNALKFQRNREEDSIRFILQFLALNCPEMRSLTLPPHTTTDHLAMLSHFPRLEYLALAGWARVTEEGLLDFLPACCSSLDLSYTDPHLDALNMYKTKVSNESLVYLPPTLRTLKYVATTIIDRSLKIV